MSRRKVASPAVWATRPRSTCHPGCGPGGCTSPDPTTPRTSDPSTSPPLPPQSPQPTETSPLLLMSPQSLYGPGTPDLQSSPNSPTLSSDQPPPDSNAQAKAQLWRFQALALVCALLLSVGGHYSAHTLSALKATVKKDFGISNTQYGLLQSAVSLVNTVLPVLGGLFIDAFGTSSGSILATSFILIGTSVVAMSTHYQSFPIMVVGRLLYGLGSGTIVTIQETILSHWFTGKGLAMTIALQIATARLASFLSMGTTVPIANATGFYGYAFWASAFICLCSWIINFVYVMLMKRVDEHMTEHELAKLKRKNTFRLRHVLIFPAAYWLIVALSFVLGSGWTTFLHISSELVKLRFGCDDSTAAHIASVSQLLPVILVPFLGLWVDRNGHRVTLLILAASLFLGTIILLGFTTLPPAVGMFVFSVSLSVGPISSISSIPLVLPLSTVGSGLGLFKSAQNIGNTILDIIIGQLQDAHPLRGVHPPHHRRIPNEHSYDRVMVFYLYWGGLTLLVALTLYAIDRLGWDRLLQLSDIRRLLWVENHPNVFCHYQLDAPPSMKWERIEGQRNQRLGSSTALTRRPSTRDTQLPRTLSTYGIGMPEMSDERRGSCAEGNPSYANDTGTALATVVAREGRLACQHNTFLNEIETCVGRQCSECHECNRNHVADAFLAYGGPLLAQNTTDSPGYGKGSGGLLKTRRTRSAHISPSAGPQHHEIRYSPILDPVAGPTSTRDSDLSTRLHNQRISLVMDGGTSVICSSSVCSKNVCSPTACASGCFMSNQTSGSRAGGSQGDRKDESIYRRCHSQSLFRLDTSSQQKDVSKDRTTGEQRPWTLSANDLIDQSIIPTPTAVSQSPTQSLPPAGLDTATSSPQDGSSPPAYGATSPSPHSLETGVASMAGGNFARLHQLTIWNWLPISTYLALLWLSWGLFIRYLL